MHAPAHPEKEKTREDQSKLCISPLEMVFHDRNMGSREDWAFVGPAIQTQRLQRKTHICCCTPKWMTIK